MPLWDRIMGRGIEEDVLRDLVDCMYGSIQAVILSIIVLFGYGLFCSVYAGDPVLTAIIFCGVGIGLARCAVAWRYRYLCTEGLLAREKLERAQILYAFAGIAYAASLGLVTARAAFNPDGYVYGLAVVLTASYAQGLLIYVSVRPAIAMAQSVVPMLLAMPAALASPFFAYQLTAPMYLFPIMLCANACRLQSRLFFELFHSRHVLLREANSDALTGLSNRRGLDNQIERVGSDQMLAVLYLDLDGFKVINDRHGHEAGDVILRKVADKLRALLQPGDVCARMGGDEFVILLRGDRACDARTVAEEAITLIDGVYDVSATSVEISASVGLSCGITGMRPISDILRDADSAMYAAKRAGRGQIREASGLASLLEPSPRSVASVRAAVA